MSVADPRATVSPALTLPASSTQEAPAKPPRSVIQTKLLDNARDLLDDHQADKALALLTRVTAPDLVRDRDALRERALRERTDARPK